MNNRYTTIKELPKIYPFLKESSARWFLRNKDINGFNKCLCKIGRRFYVDTTAFEEWMNENNLSEEKKI